MLKYIFAIVVIVVAALILAILLAVADKFFKVEEDPRKDDILGMLPGANCGACGFPGCAGLADAMVVGKNKKATDCKVIKGESAEALQKYLDEMGK